MARVQNAGNNPVWISLSGFRAAGFPTTGKNAPTEQWMKPAGQSMMGMSRTVAGGKTVFTEYLQIREREGQVAYIAAIGIGAKPVVFRQIKRTDAEVVFENPEHDFPQRIIYRRESADKLFARIEGKEKGSKKEWTFVTRARSVIDWRAGRPTRVFPGLARLSWQCLR